MSDQKDEGTILGSFALFSGLPEILKKDLIQSRRYEAHTAGVVFVQQGEYTENFHVIVSGTVSAYRTNPDGKTVLVDTLAPGGWFGEVSALSNAPSLATLKADTPCTALVLDPASFKRLYTHKGAKAFRETIDKRYRERALALHMRAMPLFEGASDTTLARLRDGVRLEVFEKDVEIARQGESADSVYLVRSGAVSCTHKDANGIETILSYAMNNSSFGERSIAADTAKWPGTYRTLARTDVLILPAALVRTVLAQDAGALDALRERARALANEEHGETSSGAESDDRLEILVRRQSIKGGEALVIDLTRCTRCNACVESCVAAHDDRVPRLSKAGNRISAGMTLATSCYNCQIPECMMSCNYGAIRRDVRGLIRFVYDNCVGCASCVSACPYGVIRLTAPPGAATVVEDPNPLASLPLIGHWFRPKTCETPKPADGPLKNAKGQEVRGKAVKCDLCAGLPFEACVYNCPCSAIQRVNPAQLFEREDVKERLAVLRGGDA